MTNVTDRTIVSVRHETLVPLGADGKAVAAEMQFALHSAGQRFADIKGRKVSFDDDLMISTDDEHVIVSFTVESERTGVTTISFSQAVARLVQGSVDDLHRVWVSDPSLRRRMKLSLKASKPSAEAMG